MSNTFTITYANGMTEDVQMDLETAEEACGQIFGRTLAEASEIGCNVVLVGEFVPEELDLTGTIVAFTQGNPTVVTTDVEDKTVLVTGNKLKLEPLTGALETMEVLDGVIVDVLQVFPLTTLDLDTSALDVTGLTADYEIEAAEPAEETLPPPPAPPTDAEAGTLPADTPAAPWTQPADPPAP